MPSFISKAKLFPQRYFLLVFLVSALIAIAVGFATWNMQFWPSDERAYYFEPALKLPHLHYLSQMHELMDAEKVRWLHGKEILILCLSLAQRLLHDFTTIRPFVLLFILANFLSSVLVFVIGRRLWGEKVGLVCYLAFAGSLWPYLYILFAKHQPLGLVFFLLAFYWLLAARVNGWKRLLFGGAGFLLGLSFFSSTVSPLYVPFFAAGFLMLHIGVDSGSAPWGKKLGALLVNGILVLAGVSAVVLWVNWPDVIGNIKSYRDYVAISGSYNHFYYAQPFLQQWFGTSVVSGVRGGVEWIVKYFMVIMPVLFPAYLVAVASLLFRAVKTKSGRVAFMDFAAICLSLAPPAMAEVAKVAQDGGNYFPSLVGIVFLLGYAAHRYQADNVFGRLSSGGKKVVWSAGILIAVFHVATSGYVFATDVYPTRLVMTYFSRQLAAHNVRELYTYAQQPHRWHFATTIAPAVAKNISLKNLQYLIEAKQGYVMVPPLTGDSIYVPATSHYVDFDSDPFLNELRQRGKLKDYAVVSFRTLANSRIWLHEEEILSYRKLILNQPIGEDDEGGRVWLLDAVKLNRDRQANVPSEDAVFLEQNHVRNVGTRSRISVFRGTPLPVKTASAQFRVVTRMYKVGAPQDSLQAFLYKLDNGQAVWIPVGKRFFSQPVNASSIGVAREGGAVIFDFQLPGELPAGLYFLAIYRRGPPDDNNFYRIYTQDLALPASR